MWTQELNGESCNIGLCNICVCIYVMTCSCNIGLCNICVCIYVMTCSLSWFSHTCFCITCMYTDKSPNSHKLFMYVTSCYHVPIFMSISDSRTFCVADYINVELYLVYCTCICN